MSSSEKYAIAIDLGTTTIAAALVRLPEGTLIASEGGLNPQRSHGLDVISRLEYAGRSPEHLKELKELINSELSRLARDITAKAGIDGGSLEMVAVAGNPTMAHLLLGLDIKKIAHPPYRPRFTGAHTVRTAELDWQFDAPLYVFPSPGGFVGGDTVAFLFGQGFPDPCSQLTDPALFLDLGTNGEIALLADGRLFATSAAAGPAFEAGNLSCGMAALPGAIFSVTSRDGRIVTETVAGAAAKGLCGSGVLDCVALLLSEGLMDATGRLLDPAETDSILGSRLQDIGEERHFVIYRDAKGVISLSQADIRHIQLAKGAVRAAMEVLFHRADINGDDLKKVVLTGSFGASLRLESLEKVGVLTQNMVKNAGFVREGALAGVIRFLTRPDGMKQAESLSSSLKIIPLSGTPLFESRFMEHMNFPP
ncbi:MAG: DUF4445 domain-containing protein [Geobacteraceae bacterium]|nr:DUF4445 domain-containing protein [Geobacteraceae bacterium]